MNKKPIITVEVEGSKVSVTSHGGTIAIVEKRNTLYYSNKSLKISGDEEEAVVPHMLHAGGAHAIPVITQVGALVNLEKSKTTTINVNSKSGASIKFAKELKETITKGLVFFLERGDIKYL